MDKKKRKYNSNFRKKLSEKIKKIKNDKIYFEIYEIIKNETKVTINSNGVFFDFNKLSNDVIEKIIDITNNILTSTSEQETTSVIEYIPYSTDELKKIDIIGNRLSNQEKQFLKINKN